MNLQDVIEAVCKKDNEVNRSFAIELLEEVGPQKFLRLANKFSGLTITFPSVDDFTEVFAKQNPASVKKVRHTIITKEIS